MLIPRMTMAQRMSIANPTEGLTVYQTDDNKGFWHFNGSEWLFMVAMPGGGTVGQVITFCGSKLTWTTNGACPPLVTSLNCSGATNNGTLTQGTAASGVSSVIAYAGGNGVAYTAQNISSTGVIGLTATLAVGTLANGNGTVTYNITGTPNTSGTASFAISLGGQSCTLTRTVDAPLPAITSLNCAGATNNGTLKQGTAASGISSIIPYTGGNGGAYTTQTISSTGVTGLTATLTAGTLANGSGSLTINISGTPSASGTASFDISLGGQNCTLNRTVDAIGLNNIAHTCGAANVHNSALNYGSMTDQEGNQYKTITIGSQTWMAENLRTTKYNDGSDIPNITGGTQWANQPGAAYCSYNNNTANDCPYGKLYNWYTVLSDRICPAGWHVPLEGEWVTLENVLGGESAAQIKLKSTGTTYWQSPNAGTNESGFSALPGGARGFNFFSLNQSGVWWSRSVIEGTDGIIYAKIRSIPKFVFISSPNNAAQMSNGYSIRCVKDAANPPIVTSINCAGAANNGSISAGVEASGVSTVISYTGGNGAPYVVQVAYSSGVLGLTATLAAGTLANGNGTLTFVITGNPRNSGTASFSIRIGDQSCSFTRIVNGTAPQFNSNLTYGSLTDNNGNTYKTIQIGSQTWMAENLKSGYLNISKADWQNNYNQGLKQEATVAYNNDVKNYDIYGTLFNFYALRIFNNKDNVCPTGWHVPSVTEFQTLVTQVGSLAGAMKSTGFQFWYFPNEGATNSSGFSALPGGICGSLGYFQNLKSYGCWWTNEGGMFGSRDATAFDIDNTRSSVWQTTKSTYDACSVRCVKD